MSAGWSRKGFSLPLAAPFGDFWRFLLRSSFRSLRARRSHFATFTSFSASGYRWLAALLRPMAIPRSSSTRGVHPTACGFTCQQSRNEYPNLPFPFLSLKVETLLYSLFVLLLSLLLWFLPLLLFVVGCCCRCTSYLLWFVFFFLVIHNADASSRDIDQAIDGALHRFVPWRHPDPHPEVVFSSKCLRVYFSH